MFEMTSQKEEGDYVDMSGLVLIDYFYKPILIRVILSLLGVDFICIWHIWISFNNCILMADITLFLLYFF